MSHDGGGKSLFWKSNGGYRIKNKSGEKHKDIIKSVKNKGYKFEK